MRTFSTIFSRLLFLLLLGNGTLFAQYNNMYYGVLRSAKHPSDASQPEVLSLVTDIQTMLLRDESGALIPAQKSLTLSDYPVQLDSVYSMRILPLMDKGNAYEYKDVKQLYKGEPYVRLQGYFFDEKMGSDNTGTPLPGLNQMFKSEKKKYAIGTFDPSRSRNLLGGSLPNPDAAAEESHVFCDVLFIQLHEDELVPYKLLSKKSTAIPLVAHPSEILIADEGDGCCRIQNPASEGEVFIYSASGVLLSRHRITKEDAAICNLPREEVLLFCIKTSNSHSTFKIALQ